MERLTNRGKKAISLTSENSIRWMAIHYKLKQYEDVEEDGLLVRLPFKINKTVWCIDFKRVDRYDITGFSLGKTFTDDEPLTEEELICHYANYSGSVNGSFAVSEIGKTVFFTQEEAEAKLKEMEGEDAN